MVRIEKKMTMSFVSRFILPVFLCLVLCLASCNMKSDEENFFSISFKKIYDNPGTFSYTALDIKQISRDEGYIILGKVNGFECPYLLRVDKYGVFLWDTRDSDVFAGYKNPVPELKISDKKNRTFYFFCNKINGGNITLYLLEFSENNKDVCEKTEISHSNPLKVNYPNVPYYLTPKYAVMKGEKNYVLVNLNNIGDARILVGDEVNRSWYAKVNDKKNFSGWICFSEYVGTDRRFHYSGISKHKRVFYFHTFQKNTLNVDLSNCFLIEMEAPGDNSTSHHTILIEKPIIAMEWDDSQWDISNYDGLKLAGAYIDSGILYFFINAGIKKNEETQHLHVEFEIVHRMLGLLETKPVYIYENDQKIVFFAATDRNNRIILSAYDRLTGAPFNKEIILGEIRLYEAAGLIDTGDGGLAILGTTSVVGQLNRICLFKLSKTEVEEMCRQ